MNTLLQSSFVNRVTDSTHQQFLQKLHAYLGMIPDYRVCEMPVFITHDFADVLQKAACDILQQCISAAILTQSSNTLESRFTVPSEDPKPLFSVVDFAVVQADDGSFQPRLIELQGFPSLLGYQYAYAALMAEHYRLPCSPFLGKIARQSEYVELLSKAIFAETDPEHTALVEVDPERQKTRTDFNVLQRLLGLQVVNIRNVVARGHQLWVENDQSEWQLKRIFNRAIIDELDDLNVRLRFDWRRQYDVEWAGHPNWYFRISKHTMPFLDHPTVPRTMFVNDTERLPRDVEGYVLKPLYSFAGKGVNLSPSWRDIESIPIEERSTWILQERVQYANCLPTPYGLNRVEIRIMLIWPPDELVPLPVMTLARTGRGEMMGARYNTDPWTGSSGCLICSDPG